MAYAFKSCREPPDDLLVARLAMLLLQSTLTECSNTFRCKGSTAARMMLADLEADIAERLLRMLTISPTIQSRPDIITAVALRVRAELRAGHVCP
ncbi:hypothetical protein J2X36_005050 [Methylobacterium sp. BE186]|uniref:hypothetical protein n=1 Tax=Methylobacterium sp. BE186 TaxID=2817715 RepID=UPI0028595B85|nr:hypothetical protein [Methylobacterium sp. BE186]MDR7040268.1 hypothetical protein [Methylobacterium sp. BE186]